MTIFDPSCPAAVIPAPGSPPSSCSRWKYLVFGDCVCSARDAASLYLGLFSIACWAVAEVPQVIANCQASRSGVELEEVPLALVLTWIVGCFVASLVTSPPHPVFSPPPCLLSLCHSLFPSPVLPLSYRSPIIPSPCASLPPPLPTPFSHSLFSSVCRHQMHASHPCSFRPSSSQQSVQQKGKTVFPPLLPLIPRLLVLPTSLNPPHTVTSQLYTSTTCVLVLQHVLSACSRKRQQRRGGRRGRRLATPSRNAPLLEGPLPVGTTSASAAAAGGGAAVGADDGGDDDSDDGDYIEDDYGAPNGLYHAMIDEDSASLPRTLLPLLEASAVAGGNRGQQQRDTQLAPVSLSLSSLPVLEHAPSLLDSLSTFLPPNPTPAGHQGLSQAAGVVSLSPAPLEPAFPATPLPPPSMRYHCAQCPKVTFESTQVTFESTQVTFESTQVTFESTQVTFESTQVTFESTQN
ncbi:unnamed protein product [Closterium sp. NIES-65]|nr:unnamed protein product [Closterium sp. NIES-65]